ncbi:hypothetical protein KY335_01000, partial [Candidatus Woesearchaeota archaeon]|nr:hypothetical protein [Candidatus Woesearchaeota archaeon]
DLQKKKVGAVYTGNELKHEEIAKRIWRLEGKDPAWRTLQFCVEEAKKRGDYRQVTDNEYHTIAVLLAKKVVEPLAQGSTDRIPVAVQRDGTWWKERMENLTWETRRAPGDFVASLWECYQMFKGTEEEQKWLGYARKWMEIFKRINADNIDAYTGKALLENHFVAMEVDPDPARREEYKQEIRCLCDLIVKKRWNEELGFLTHYVLDGDQDKRDRLYSAVMVDVLALYLAHNLFRNPEYKEKADKTLEKLLTHIKASQHPKDPQIYNFVGFEKNGNPMFFHYNLGCIEMYIQYATALIEIYNISKNENCKNFAECIFTRIFDSINFNEIPYYSLFSYIVSENSTNEIAQSYRKFGMKKSQRLLAETIFFAEKLKNMVNNRAKESGQARYTLVCTITTSKAWGGISNSDVANITEDVQNQQVAGIKDRGISSNVDTTHTTHIYELAYYFKALRKK